MTYDGDRDPPKPHTPSSSAIQGKDVPLMPLAPGQIQHLLSLINNGRVFASVRNLNEEVVFPEDTIVDELRVLHVAALYVREEEQEGRWVITRDQASALIEAGARGVE